jgi:hypothetical protein
MRFLRLLEGFVGVFQGLFGMLVSGLVVFFAVVRGGGAVGVGSEFVELGSSYVRFIWHGVSSLGSFHFPSCPITDTLEAASFWNHAKMGISGWRLRF